MIKTAILTEQKDIESIKEEWLSLAIREKAPLPFQYMYMPLTYWYTFHDNGEPFWKKRGKNFLGVQSSLKKFYLLIARNNGRLCGVLPLSQFAVKLRGDSQNIKIIAMPGDYVLHPYQDFLVTAKRRQEVLEAMLQCLPAFLADNDLVWLGYIPSDSPNLKILQNAVKSLTNCEILEAISGERGGVWPWRLGKIVSILKEIERRCDIDDIEIVGLEKVIDKMEACSPQALLFPNTRVGFLKNILSILPKLPQHEDLSYLAEKLRSLLNDSPMLYPYIELPPDWEDYLRSLSTSTRRHCRRYMKKYFNAGGSFEVVESNAISEIDIDDYIRLHLLRWGNETAAMSGESIEYHREITCKLAAEDIFSLFFACYEGRRIAVIACLDIERRRNAYILGVHPDFFSLGPGRLLILHTIYDAIEKGMMRYELGAVSFDYKMSFANKVAVAHNFFFSRPDYQLKLDNLFAGFECMLPVVH